MAFTKIDEYTAKAFEKGIASGAVKVADLRWTDYGVDLKKATLDDNACVGPVVYVKIPDPKNAPTVGNITKMFFHCRDTDFQNRYAVIETTLNVANAIGFATAWVETISGLSAITLGEKCPAVS